MNNSTHNPSALLRYKKLWANRLGLTVREFDANYDVYENTYGYHHREKVHVSRNIRAREQREEFELYEHTKACYKQLGY